MTDAGVVAVHAGLIDGRERDRRCDVLARRDRDADVRALVHAGAIDRALELLMQRHGVAIHRYCRAELRDAALADDVHQQVFIEALRDLPRFSGRSTMRVWLFAIARHRVLDAAKQRRRWRARVDREPRGETVDLRPLPSESIDDARLRRALLDSLEALAPRVRTAVLLRYQQDLSFEEISQICREKPGTLHARVTRAMPVLRAQIEARLRDTSAQRTERSRTGGRLARASSGA